MLHAFLTAVVQSHDLKALIRRYEHTEDCRAAHIHVLRATENEFYGNGCLSEYINYINSRTSHDKQDPPPFYDDTRSTCVCFKRMSPDDPLSSTVVSSVDVSAIEGRPLYNTFMVLHHDLEGANVDELEQRIMAYRYQYVHHMEHNLKLGPKILMTSDLSGDLDDAFAMCARYRPYPLCVNSYVYYVAHIFWSIKTLHI